MPASYMRPILTEVNRFTTCSDPGHIGDGNLSIGKYSNASASFCGRTFAAPRSIVYVSDTECLRGSCPAMSPGGTAFLSGNHW